MYLYFDSEGNLKEAINDSPARVGNSNWNCIYAYVDGRMDSSTDAYINYLKPDGTSTGAIQKTSKVTDTEVPYSSERDLKYFAYFTEYDFYKFTVPSAVLSDTGAVTFSIYLTFSGSSNLNCGKYAFMVDGTGSFDVDEHVNIAEYNSLLNAIGNKADDDEVVHTAGNESVAGVKTFTGQLELTGTSDTIAKKTDLQIFFATTATYASITSAVTNGKIPVIVHDGTVYVLSGKDDSDGYTFAAVSGKTVRKATVNTNGTKTYGTYTIQEDKLTQSISGDTGSTEKYPSVAAVEAYHDSGKEDTSNKTDTLNASSTNTQYPGAKAVYDAVQDAKAYTDTKVTGLYKYKGSCTYANLPASGMVTGDTWNVTDAHGGHPAGTNWAWNGTEWDALGGSIDLSDYYTKSETGTQIANAKQIYWCTYGTSTYTDIRTAVEAEKIAAVYVGSTLCFETHSDDGLRFAGVYRNTDTGKIYIVTAFCSTASAWTNVMYSMQTELTSGTTLKTVNGETLLGSGDIDAGGTKLYKHAVDLSDYKSFVFITNSDTAIDTTAKIVSACSSAVARYYYTVYPVVYTTINGASTYAVFYASSTGIESATIGTQTITDTVTEL